VLWTNSKRRNGERLIRVPRQLAPFLVRLAAHRKPEEPLFAHAATRARPQDWAREQVWRLCKLAGVPEVTPHGLRGTLATMGKELGELSQHVADALDHASTAMTERARLPVGGPGAAGGSPPAALCCMC
jgi:integrase